VNKANAMNNTSQPTAIALEYDQLNAPTVSAKGSDEIAEHIIAIAKENGVPLYQNPELARLLMSLELADEIPENLYICIAQIIAFAYKIQNKYPPGWEPSEQFSDDNESGSIDASDHLLAAPPAVENKPSTEE
jgi:flagellar biosynthesis protein